MKNKKGVLSFYVVFLIVAITIIVIAAIFVPMGIRFTSEVYAAGEDILLDANSTIANISDSEVRESIQNSLNLATDSVVDNIEINSNIFRYSWLIVLLIGLFIVVLAARKNVEVGGGGQGFT